MPPVLYILQLSTLPLITVLLHPPTVSFVQPAVFVKHRYKDMDPFRNREKRDFSPLRPQPEQYHGLNITRIDQKAI